MDLYDWLASLESGGYGILSFNQQLHVSVSYLYSFTACVSCLRSSLKESSVGNSDPRGQTATNLYHLSTIYAESKTFMYSKEHVDFYFQSVKMVQAGPYDILVLSQLLHAFHIKLCSSTLCTQQTGTQIQVARHVSFCLIYVISYQTFTFSFCPRTLNDMS